MEQTETRRIEAPKYYAARAGDKRLIHDLVGTLRAGSEEMALAYTLRCLQ